MKGSFDTPRDLALDAGSAALADRYDEYASLLLASGHPCAIATHDIDRVAHARRFTGGDYYFEVLQGIGDELATDLHAQGYPTQVYVVYGTQEWLYLCNRLAEDPLRVLRAIIDVAELG